jgi:hypothetical protein
VLGRTLNDLLANNGGKKRGRFSLFEDLYWQWNDNCGCGVARF